jgi:hypothetical protein
MSQAFSWNKVWTASLSDFNNILPSDINDTYVSIVWINEVRTTVGLFNAQLWKFRWWQILEK